MAVCEMSHHFMIILLRDREISFYSSQLTELSLAAYG